jgi:hypothetical protein
VGVRLQLGTESRVGGGGEGGGAALSELSGRV